MTSDLSPDDKRILERYLSRKSAPAQAVPVVDPVVAQNVSAFSIEDIIKNGRTFSDSTKVGDKYVGLPIALKQALDFATVGGIVVTMPELIASKIKAAKTHDFWKNWYSVQTEENIGLDKKGRFYDKDKPVLVIVNGGGILTPDRINKAYTDGLINGSAKYVGKEFDNLLDGKLPDNTSIQIYRFDEIKKGIKALPHKFGVVMPYSLAQGTSSGYHKKDSFINNPLVIARAGGIENLEKYYDLAKDNVGDLGNHHPYSGRDASVSSGRLLFLYDDCGGLDGDDGLSGIGRFVGVAPEAQRKKK
jgi:hypothetical protein